MSGRRHARHVRLFRSKHCLLPEHGWFDDACCYCSEHRDYSDNRFILFVGSVAWFVSVCWRIDYLCCDCHNACCYCAEYRVYADAWFSLSAWWVDWLLPICGNLDRLHCDNNNNGVVYSAGCYCAEYWNYSDYFDSSDDANNCLCVYHHLNNYLCGYYHHIHIAANVSGCDSVYVDRRHLPLDQTVLRLIYS